MWTILSFPGICRTKEVDTRMMARWKCRTVVDGKTSRKVDWRKVK